MQNNQEWTETKLATIEPQWTPNLSRARATLNARLSEPQPRRPWLPIAAATAAAIILVSLPQSRAIAQDLWFRTFLNRIDVVRVDWSKLPLDTHITSSLRSEQVAGVVEAQAKAGFQPNLPRLETLEANPAISVVSKLDIQQQIDVPKLEEALRKAGASELTVPSSWHGQVLAMTLGPIVEMNYKSDVQVLQAQPIELRMPAGFPLAHFAELAFRSAGLSWWESRALAERFAANPAWLLDIPADEAALVQEIKLVSGKGFVVEDRDDKGNLERITVLFQSPERIYAVSGPNRELCVQIANSLVEANHVAVAND